MKADPAPLKPGPVSRSRFANARSNQRDSTHLRRCLFASLLLVLSTITSGTASAEGTTLTFLDQNNTPLPWVVLRYRTDADEESPRPVGTPTEYVVDQRNKRFTPLVSSVPIGATVRFPNSDDIRHHVYSFSAGNAFERKLYRADDAEPVVFNTEGIVAMGCNIHDNMQAFVLVTNRPTWISDEQGMITLPDGFDADATELWHPLLNGEGSFIPIPATTDTSNTISLPLQWRDPQTPRSQGDLENLLKRFSGETS